MATGAAAQVRLKPGTGDNQDEHCHRFFLHELPRLFATSLGDRVKGVHPDSRGSISIGPDGRVYSVVRVDNKTGFGTGYLSSSRLFPSRNRGVLSS